MPIHDFELQPERPYSLERTAARLVRYSNLIDRWSDAGEYSRCLHLDGALAVIRVQQSGTSARALLHVRVEGSRAKSQPVREAAEHFVRRALGAACKLRPFYRSLGDDPFLAAAIRAHRGLSLCGGATLFEAIVTTILAQQVNLQFAYSVYDDLATRYGERLEVAGETRIAFPTASRIARVRESTLCNMRLSRAKAAALRRMARACANGELAERELATLPDEVVIDRLMAYKGIGRWTAETVLIRGLGRLDVFPAGDLGVVKKIAKEMLGRTEVAREDEMRDFSRRWQPHRSLALVYAYAELYGRTQTPSRR